jgi:hypothetical protein
MILKIKGGVLLGFKVYGGKTNFSRKVDNVTLTFSFQLLYAAAGAAAWHGVDGWKAAAASI